MLLVNNYKTNKASTLKKTYYNLIDDVVINKQNTAYTNDNINVTEINKFVNVNANSYVFHKEHRTYK